MDDLHLAADGYPDFDNQNHIHFQYLPAMSTWSLPLDPPPPPPPNPDDHHHPPPASSNPPHSHHPDFYSHALNPSRPIMTNAWHPAAAAAAYHQQQQQQQQQSQQQQSPQDQHQQQHQQHQPTQHHHSQQHQPPHHPLLDQHSQQQAFDNPFSPSHIQPSTLGFMPQQPPTLNTAMHLPYTTSMEYPSSLVTYQTDLQNNLVQYPLPHQRFHQSAPFGQAGLLGTSPPDHPDNLSSSGSESGWQLVDYPARSSFESQYSVSASVNPSLTLNNHVRTESSSSQDMPGSARSVESFDDCLYPISPGHTDETLDHTSQHLVTSHSGHSIEEGGRISPLSSSPSTSSSTSPVSPTATSPTQRRKKDRGAVAKSTAKPSVVKVVGPAPKKSVTSAGEKRVGRRRGPLRPEQRIQAGEIRKLRACLRCKFLKKTCDKGDPCAGCQPSHARLWQVPCTRIDIKDIGYFIKDWKADYERHVTLQVSIANIRGYSPLERTLYVSHGFGYMIPVQAREVFVRDEDCFNMDWVETNEEKPKEFDVPTARLTAGIDGISSQMLSDYLDRHIDDGFEHFVDKQFEGTLFLTEMLKTTHGYYQRTQLPVIRKALKFVIAYNLTQHITLVEGLSEEESQVGRIDDEGSKYYNKTLAPVMISFQVKTALAMIWRDLQREVLEELSVLFASVYSGEKLKHWPTICVLVFVLLAVWEEIQFDSYYRQPENQESVKKFCQDMESVPIGVIVGLFQAISQKLPAFQEWDTNKHHQLLYSNQAVCDAMTEIREHVNKYEDYLKSRADCKFDRSDFDSLANKFTSKLVIRAH